MSKIEDALKQLGIEREDIKPMEEVVPLAAMLVSALKGKSDDVQVPILSGIFDFVAADLDFSIYELAALITMITESVRNENGGFTLEN